MKKIAFLFLTKLNFNKYNLWKKYLKGNSCKYNIYIHPYSFYNKSIDKIKNSFIQKHTIKNIVETDYLHVYNAILELYKEAIKNKDNYKFILLSESDIPITSFDVMYNYLIKNNNAYVGCRGEKGVNICNKCRNNLSSNEYKNRINHLPKELSIIPKNKYIRHSAWHCLNRQNIIDLLTADTKYHNIFKKINIGNEHYLTILALNNQCLNIHNNPIIYVNWKETGHKYNKIKKHLDELYNEYDKDKTNLKLKSKINELKIVLANVASHPKLYQNKITKEDIVEIVKSKSLFARKFDKSSNIDKYWNKLIKYNNKWFE